MAGGERTRERLRARTYYVELSSYRNGARRKAFTRVCVCQYRELVRRRYEVLIALRF